jgi:hypothetical protein
MLYVVFLCFIVADIVEVSEQFGRSYDDPEDEYNGNPMFGRVTVTVQNTQHALHQVTLQDNVYSPGRPSRQPYSNKKAAKRGGNLSSLNSDIDRSSYGSSSSAHTPGSESSSPPEVAIKHVEVKPLISHTETEVIALERPKFALKQSSLAPDFLKIGSPQEVHEENNNFNRSIQVLFLEDEGIVDPTAETGSTNSGNKSSPTEKVGRSKSIIGRNKSVISRAKSSVGDASFTRKSFTEGTPGKSPALSSADLAVQAVVAAKSAAHSALGKLFQNVDVDLHVGIDVESRAFTTGLSVLDLLPRVLVTPEYTIDLSSLESIPYDEELDDEENEEDNDDVMNEAKGDDVLGSLALGNKSAISSTLTGPEAEEEKLLRRRSDGLPNKQLARKVEDVIDIFRYKHFQDINNYRRKLDEGISTPILDGNWFFILEESLLKLVSANPRVSQPELEPSELFLRDFGFQLSYCETHPEVKVIYRDMYLVPVEDPDESYKYTMVNYTGTAGVPTIPPHFMTNVFEVIAKDEIRTVVKNYFKGLARRRLDAKISVAQTLYDETIAAFERKLEAEMAKRVNKRLLPEDIRARNAVTEDAKSELSKIPSVATYQEVYEEMIRCINAEHHSSSSSESKALSPPASSGGGGGWGLSLGGLVDNLASGLGGLLATGPSTDSDKKAPTQLEFNQLIQYLRRDKDVSGIDKVFTRGQAMYVLDNMRPNPQGFVSIELFKQWYEALDGHELSNSLSQETMFALLLHEHMTLRERTHINKRTRTKLDRNTGETNEVPYVKEPKEILKRPGVSVELSQILLIDNEVVSENEPPVHDPANDEDDNRRTFFGHAANLFGHAFDVMGKGLKGTEHLMTAGVRAAATKSGKFFKKDGSSAKDGDEDAEDDEDKPDDGADGDVEDGKNTKAKSKRPHVGFFGFGRKSSKTEVAPDNKEEAEPETQTPALSEPERDSKGASESLPEVTQRRPFSNTMPQATKGDTNEIPGITMDDVDVEVNSFSAARSSADYQPAPSSAASQSGASEEYHTAESASGMYKFFGSKQTTSSTTKNSRRNNNRLAAEYELGVLNNQRAEVIDVYDSVE